MPLPPTAQPPSATDASHHRHRRPPILPLGVAFALPLSIGSPSVHCHGSFDLYIAWPSNPSTCIAVIDLHPHRSSNASDLKVKDTLIQERDRLYNLLKEVPFLNPYPSYSNFILCEVASGMDAKVLKVKMSHALGYR
ncbi:hypothetical protein SO802_009534 [Lithocarpus litseifolius]|uniref:Uncharacterized protein n=1 Tax=Lithocarpus litseifolius TaxID=425828 RepID=A0AAW2DBN0_9ROSI